ncbi:MAG: ATP-binding protein [Actinomycetota bacterium]|nr:ATP-binding protein [Actinomycetota bacterium]
MSAPDLPARRGRLGRLALAQRLVLSFSALAAIALAAIGVGVWAYQRQLSASHHVIGVVDKARLDANSLLADYVDEETGVRGYILARQPTFLAPYRAGVARALRDRSELEALVALDARSRRLLAPLDAATKRWHQDFALPAITAVRAGRYAVATQLALARGNVEFGAIRRAFSRLSAGLAASAAASAGTLSSAETTFIVLAIVLLALLAGAGVAAAFALRAWVSTPIRLLSAGVGEVAGGHLDHVVAIEDPPDLAALAHDVDAMRVRIVEELRALNVASAALADANEELRRSNLELEQFAYVASHDLQEPLRKVVSFCELLARRYGDGLDDRAHQYIAYAVDGATRMQVLINDLLAFSRVGRQSAAFGEVPLAEACQAALDNLAHAIDERAAEITVEPLPAVMGDLALLSALFQNLIANAIKFNDATPVVRVDAARDGNCWRISVSDNGIGIEPRFAERVFVIFQRLHGRDAYSGTGIGLALCKKIVEFHGGRIWLDTQYASGTRISFTLPAIGAT